MFVKYAADGGGGRKLGFENVEDKDDKWDIILPQGIAMGTITRRAIEKKLGRQLLIVKKNQLKPMVRAPPGYAIVGVDVDAELWIYRETRSLVFTVRQHWGG